MQTHEIVQKIKLSKSRVEKFRNSIQEEESIQSSLIKELVESLSADLGQSVNIGASDPKAGNRNMVDVTYRVYSLMSEGNEFKEIAKKLNQEGLKTSKGHNFTSQSISQLSKSKSFAVLVAKNKQRESNAIGN